MRLHTINDSLKVEELGEELVVGSGCLYVDARSVISPFALSDLRKMCIRDRS